MAERRPARSRTPERTRPTPWRAVVSMLLSTTILIMAVIGIQFGWTIVKAGWQAGNSTAIQQKAEREPPRVHAPAGHAAWIAGYPNNRI